VSKTEYTIEYHPSLTQARFSGSITLIREKETQLLLSTTAEADAILVTTADPRVTYKCLVKTRWIADVNVSLGLTDDQRLTAVSSESTGELGVVATQVLGAAATVGGVAVGLSGLVRAPEGEASPMSLEEAYAEKYADRASLRDGYATLLTDVLKRIQEQTAALVSAQPALRSETLAQLKVLRVARTTAEAEIARLDGLFSAWSAAQHSATVTNRVIDVELDRLPLHDAVTPDPGEGGRPATGVSGSVDENKLIGAKEPWDIFGMLVTIHRIGKREPGSNQTPEDSPQPYEGVLVRESGQVEWRLWARSSPDVSGDKSVHLVREGTAPYVDLHSRVSDFDFRRSLWGKRTVKVELSDLGVVKEFDATSTSAAAAEAAALGGAVGAVGAGITSAGTIVTGVYSLRDARATHALASAKRQLDAAQTQLDKDGLGATTAQYANLKQLQQQVDIAEATAKLDPTTLQTQAIQRQIDLTTAQKDQETAARELRTETELSSLRQRIDELNAKWKLANPGE
jgi:hypothetical protein